MFTKKSISDIRSLTIFLTLLALTFSFIGVTPAYAATFTVTKIADTNDGTCDGDCSLREAITAANAAAGADTITLPAGVYTLTLGSQLPAVTSAITINGSGEANTVIQANANPNTATYRVFEVTSTGDLTVGSLTVRNGRCNGSCANAADSGGGILNGGALIVSNVTFSANSATNYGGGMSNNIGSSLTLTNATFSGNSANYGGGMYNYSSNPTLTNVTFSANSAVNYGGGMYNYSSNPTLTNVTFSGNSATGGGGGMYNYSSNPMLTNVTFSGNSTASNGGGGGMYNYTSSSPTLMDVTFSGNSAYFGGGMFNNSNSNPTLTNVTFSANSAASSGGGMYNYSNSNPTLTNVTFSGNSAASSGGGMYNYTSSPTLKNTLIANSASGGDCVNNVSTLNAASSNNLIEDSANACGLTNGVNGNIIGSDPNLGALTGSPAYFPLKAGSPAIDKGDDAVCAAAPVNNTSQNGRSRPQGTHCDIGSYEANVTLTLRSAGSQDGWILESGENTTKGGTLNAGATTFALGDNAAKKQYRSILSFNTGGLPDNAVITSVKLKIKPQSIVGGATPAMFKGFLVDIRNGFFGTSALQVTDFQVAASTPLAGIAPITTSVGGWYTFNLTASKGYINKLATNGGLTQFRLRFKLDDNNNAIANYINFYSGNSAINKPTLTIQYYVP